jgi:hypothetical protein
MAGMATGVVGGGEGGEGAMTKAGMTCFTH